MRHHPRNTKTAQNFYSEFQSKFRSEFHTPKRVPEHIGEVAGHTITQSEWMCGKWKSERTLRDVHLFWIFWFSRLVRKLVSLSLLKFRREKKIFPLSSNCTKICSSRTHQNHSSAQVNNALNLLLGNGLVAVGRRCSQERGNCTLALLAVGVLAACALTASSL